MRDVYIVVYVSNTTTAFETLCSTEKNLGVFTLETLPTNPKEIWNFHKNFPDVILYATEYELEETEESITIAQFKLIKTKGYF
jgi:hypothetical protein